MRNYRELYLVSQRAIVYDVMFNHMLFNPLLALAVLGYTYTARKIEDTSAGEKIQRPTILQVMKETGVSLIQVRALVSLVSIVS